MLDDDRSLEQIDNMRIAHVLVCHSVCPRKLFLSIPSDRRDDLWYVFLHSDDKDVEAVVRAEMLNRRGSIFDYKTNRGLAKSWNDAIKLAMDASCDGILLLNDDLFFYDTAYTKFLHTVELIRSMTRNVFMITANGLESGSSPFAGEVHTQSFSCGLLTPEAIDLVGYFDETFKPAYFEDCDYMRRALLLGMTMHVDDRILLEHERSSTHKKLDEHERAYFEEAQKRNSKYFETKWGGSPSQAIFDRPFNSAEHALEIRFENRLPFKAQD